MLPLTLLTSAALAATLDVPTSYGTVQAAVDAATSGDIILVAPGTYGESVSVYKGGLTIQGDGPGVVIGPGPFGFALSHTAGDLLVQDVTLDGGGTHLAVLSSSSGHLTLERAVMRNGNTLYGGGLYSTGNDVTVLDSEFHDNVAAYGGGFYYSGYGEVLVEGSRFLGNTAYQAYGYGAGVASMGHDLTIRRSTFCGNISTDTYGRAGGVYHGGYGSFDLEESVFVGNSAGYGGALFFVTSGDVVNNTFYSNDGRLSGGAVEVQIGTVLLLNNLFVGQLGPLYAVAEDWYTYSGFLAAGTGHNLYWDNGGLDTTAGYQPTDVTADPRLAYAVADCTRFDGVRAHFDPTGQYVLLDGTRAERGEGGVGMPTLYRLPDLQKVTDLPVGAGYWFAADGSAVCTGSRERIDFGSGWLRDGFEAAPPDAPGLAEVCMSGRWVPWIHPFEPVEATEAPPLSQAVGHETQVVAGSVAPDGAALVSFGRWEVRVTRLKGGDVPRPELPTRTLEPAGADPQAAAKANTPAPVRWDGDVLLREAADGRIVRSDLHGRELGVVPGSSLPGPFDEHQSAIPEGGGLLDDGSGVWARTDAGLELRDLSGRVQRRLSGGSYHGCEVARALPGGRFLCGSGIPMLFALWGSDGQDLKGEACPTEGTMAGGASTLLVSRDGTAGIQIKVQDWGRQPGAYVCTMNLATNPPALEERFVNSRGALAAIRDNGDHAARIVSMGNSNDFGTLELWDLRTSAWTVLRAGSAPITSVAFVGDDLLAGDGDGGIWVWRLAGGLHQLGIPLAHLGRGPIRHLVPNDAGSHLAAVVPGATVLVATARNVAAEVAVRAGRQLLPSERRAAGLPVPPDATDPSLTGAGYMDPP